MIKQCEWHNKRLNSICHKILCYSVGKYSVTLGATRVMKPVLKFIYINIPQYLFWCNDEMLGQTWNKEIKWLCIKIHPLHYVLSTSVVKSTVERCNEHWQEIYNNDTTDSPVMVSELSVWGPDMTKLNDFHVDLMG